MREAKNESKKQNQLTAQIHKLQYQLSYAEHMSTTVLSVDKQMCAQLSKQMGDVNMRDVGSVDVKQHLRQLYYVQPLLMAYENKIDLLQHQLQQLRDNLSLLSAQASAIVADNAFLRSELETKDTHLLTSANTTVAVDFLRLNLQTQQQRNALLLQQNSFLVEKLKQNTHNVNQTVQQKDTSKEDKYIQKCRDLEYKYLEENKKLEIINNQLTNEKTIVRNIELKKEELQNQIYKLKNQLRANKQLLQANQAKYQSIISNLQNQMQRLKAQLSNANRVSNEQFNKAVVLQGELEDSNARCHNLSSQNSQLQSNNNSMLQMLETYQTKVSAQSKRIKNLQAEIKELHLTTAEVGKECQIAVWKAAEKEKELESKVEEWRKEKERINKVWHERIEGVKGGLFGEKKELTQEINGMQRHKKQ